MIVAFAVDVAVVVAFAVAVVVVVVAVVVDDHAAVSSGSTDVICWKIRG